jgi:hypothetical protein
MTKSFFCFYHTKKRSRNSYDKLEGESFSPESWGKLSLLRDRLITLSSKEVTSLRRRLPLNSLRSVSNKQTNKQTQKQIQRINRNQSLNLKEWLIWCVSSEQTQSTVKVSSKELNSIPFFKSLMNDSISFLICSMGRLSVFSLCSEIVKWAWWSKKVNKQIEDRVRNLLKRHVEEDENDKILWFL